MQNEVHRHAIPISKRAYSALASKLDEIKGIGPNRKKVLLANFDSLEDIQNASLDKLKALGFPKNRRTFTKSLSGSDTLSDDAYYTLIKGDVMHINNYRDNVGHMKNY